MLHRSLVRWDTSHAGVTMPRKYISLGGWCGPALILGKLGLRTEAYPFDFSRVTLDGVIKFLRDGFDESFFPPGPPPYRPECVGIWVLFRGQHTAFAHFDLNDAKVQAQFNKKMNRFTTLIDDASTPITFFRTVTARNPMEELRLVPELEGTLATRSPQLDFRIVFMVHDQGLRARAVELAPLSPRSTLWTLGYTRAPGEAPAEAHTLFGQTHQAYADIVCASVAEDNWPVERPGQWRAPVGLRESECDYDRQLLLRSPLLHPAAPSSAVGEKHSRSSDAHDVGVSFDCLTADLFPWRYHDNLALINGVAMVGGTCVGVGSTRMIATGAAPCQRLVCAYCGNSDMHCAGRPARTERPFTDDEDQLILIHLYKILTGSDKVAAVEQLAHEMQRGAFEVICRIQFLTNNSVKIMGPAGDVGADGAGGEANDETQHS